MGPKRSISDFDIIFQLISVEKCNKSYAAFTDFCIKGLKGLKNCDCCTCRWETYFFILQVFWWFFAFYSSQWEFSAKWKRFSPSLTVFQLKVWEIQFCIPSYLENFINHPIRWWFFTKNGGHSLIFAGDEKLLFLLWYLWFF